MKELIEARDIVEGDTVQLARGFGGTIDVVEVKPPAAGGYKVVVAANGETYHVNKSSKVILIEETGAEDALRVSD